MTKLYNLEEHGIMNKKVKKWKLNAVKIKINMK